MDKRELINEAENAISESSIIEFKSMVDWNNEGEFIELIKDIVSMANTDGGCIIIGLNNDGSINPNYSEATSKLDQSVIVNKIKKYSNVEFGNIELRKLLRERKEVACILVNQASKPIVFEKPGTYPDPKNPIKQKTAFSQGTLYVRHGSKSETCNNLDIQTIIDNQLEKIKDSWLGNIRRVVEAPVGHIVHMLPPDVIMRDSDDATSIRITEDSDAPVYRIETPDNLCPFRQKDIIAIVNEKIQKKHRINHYDVLAISLVYRIDASKPDMFYQSSFGPKQYSQKFIDWIFEQYKSNVKFFSEAREKYKILKSSGNRPRPPGSGDQGIAQEKSDT